MYKPVYALPPEYEKRCNDIIEGREIIDTEEKLDEFFNFTLAQGENNYGMRESIMEECEHALVRTEIFRRARKGDYDLPEKYWRAYNEVCENYIIGPSPYPEFETDEQFSDKLWNRVRAALNE